MIQTHRGPSAQYNETWYLRIRRECELWARRIPLSSDVRKFLRRLANLLPEPTDIPDYVAWFEQHELIANAGKRWKSVPLAPLESVPGMLTRAERQFLYFAAREFYSGSGEIVDAGAFLGASALALAAGLHDNRTVRHKAKRISSYDFFEFADFYRSYLPGHQLKVGEDTLALFHEF